MLPPHQVSSWISATAHLAQMSAEKRSPPPQRTPSPPLPPSDPDAPLNLSKPKSSSSGSAGSSPHSTPTSVHNVNDQPVVATAPKLLPPNLVMPRAFLPYAGLPPQFPMPTDRNKSGKDGGMVNSEKQPHFPLHMYGLPAPPHLGGRPKDEVMKEDSEFMNTCHCKLTS